MIRNISLGWSLNPKHNLILSMFVTYKIFLGGKLQISWSETKHGKFHGNSPRGVALGSRTPCAQQTSGEHRTAAAGSRQEGLPSCRGFRYTGWVPWQVNGPQKEHNRLSTIIFVGVPCSILFCFSKFGKQKGGFDGNVLGSWYQWYRLEVV